MDISLFINLSPEITANSLVYIPPGFFFIYQYIF